MHKYRMEIYWSDDDNKFIIEVPDLAGCMADGSTPEEALHNINTVISEWIETAESLGRNIPSPAERRIPA